MFNTYTFQMKSDSNSQLMSHHSTENAICACAILCDVVPNTATFELSYSVSYIFVRIQLLGLSRQSCYYVIFTLANVFPSMISY